MLSIGAVGLVSSLGNLASGCAAARAGVVRLTPLGLGLPNPGQPEASEVRGHVVPQVAGTEDYGRLVGLLHLALQDAFADGAPTTERTKVFVVLPPEEARAALALDEEDLPADPDHFVAARVSALLGRGSGGAIEVVRSLHCGVPSLIVRVAEDITRRAYDRAIVCAADSLVDLGTVIRLAAENRVRHAASPIGFHPGEAAGALVFENASADREVRPLTRIAAFAMATAAGGAAGVESPEDDATIPGTSLRRALAELERTAPRELADVQFVVDDDNGTPERVHYTWRNLLAGSSPAIRRIAGLPKWSAPGSFGELGAATPCAQIGYAVRAIARGQVKGACLVLCVDEAGGAAAIVLASDAR